MVILGALFKIVHRKGADLMLCGGMGTEALIFALSAFDKPATNYHWERVFPVLQDAEAQITDISKSLEAMMNRTSVNNGAVTKHTTLIATLQVRLFTSNPLAKGPKA